jgi:AraC family transcriptional regulator
VEEAIEQAVGRAITMMRTNLGEQLTVDDLARAAMFSKFHFTRIFQRVTGVSPGRFLSALRLQRAKYLLLSTSLNVADISLRVGYSSVGTFSSRFSRSVGLSPTTFRRLQGFAPHIPTERGLGVEHHPCALVNGYVWSSPEEAEGLVYIGLFPGPIPEGRPVSCAILFGPGRYQLDEVPPGSWYLLAQAVTGEPDDTPATNPSSDGTDVSVFVAAYGPITIRPGTVARVDVRLKPARDLDPPVLLALTDARKLALATVAEKVASTPAMLPGIGAREDLSDLTTAA